ITPDGSTMYVANSGGNNISVVDLRQRAEVRKIWLSNVKGDNNIATSVAVAGNGKVLVATREFCCTGPSDIQTIAPGFDPMSRFTEIAFRFISGVLRASDDRSTVSVISTHDSSGQIFLYRSNSDSFTDYLYLQVSLRDVAIDAAGTRTFATPSGKM